MPIVIISWEGPYSVKKAVKFNRCIDIGLYQYYGRHLVFGRDSLLYIGMAVEGKTSFSSRIKDHDKNDWKLGMDDKTHKDYAKWCKDDGKCKWCKGDGKCKWCKDDGKFEERKLYEKRRWIKDVAGLFGDVYCGRLYTDESEAKPITRKKITPIQIQQIKDAEKLLIYACSPPWNKRLGNIEDIDDKELRIFNIGSCGSLPTEVSAEFWLKEFWQNTKS